MTTIRFGVLATIWTAAALGILQLRNVQFDHALCLPGRCGPPFGAILSIQLFWLLGIVTLAAALIRFVPNWPWRNVGLFIVLTTCVGMAIVIGVDYSRWQPAYLAGTAEISSLGFQVRRFFFPIITMTDVPWLQSIVGGVMLLFVAPGRHGDHGDHGDHGERSHTEPQSP